MAFEPRVWLFGGFAEDAVLHGDVSRAHDDIDIFVWRDDADATLGNLAVLGFTTVEVRWEPRPGHPVAIGAVAADGVDVELCIADRPGWFHVDDGRVTLPADLLDHPATTLAGVEVRTVSPRALFETRRALATTFGGLRPKDEIAQRALTARFGF